MIKIDKGKVSDILSFFYRFFDSQIIKPLIIDYSYIDKIDPNFYEKFVNTNTSLKQRNKKNQIIKETIQKYLNK